MNKLSIKLLFLTILGLALLRPEAPASAEQEDSGTPFPHLLHIEDLELECETCHQLVRESVSGLDTLIPQKEVCLDCHEAEISTQYRTKALGPVADVRYFKYCTKFNHSVHLIREIPCLRCHVGIGAPDSASVEYRPPMSTCIGCHVKKHARKDCIICHETSKGKIPPNHVSPLWIRQHGDDASLDDGVSCMMCHARNDCQECHQGDNLLPRVHSPGFQFKHAIEIRTGRTECAACHEEQSFCIECHTERNVYPLSHQRASWANILPGSGGRHAVQARINIELCASCHSDEPDSDPVCAACHGN